MMTKVVIMREAEVAPTSRRKMSSSRSRSVKTTFSRKARTFTSLFFTVVSLIYLFHVFEFMRNLSDVSKNVNHDNEVDYSMGQNLNLARGKVEGIGLARLKKQYSDKYGPHYNNEYDNKNTTRLKQQQQQQHTNLDTEVEKGDNLPRGIWPIPSTVDGNNDLETIMHPGDKVTKMQVPKLWSLPIHGNTLMSRKLAMKVGICIKPDNGNFVRGESCPVNDRTINVAIASYRDFQCRYTVESIFLRAKYPQRLRVTIVDQIIDGIDPNCKKPIEACERNPNQALCLFQNQIDIFKMDAKLSVGPVFARHIGNRMYRGEYYATQIDAHVTFVQDWDVDIISQFESTKNEMAVLSTYLSDIEGAIDKHTGKSKLHTRPIMCNTDFDEGSGGYSFLMHGSQPEGRPSVHGMPQLQPWWAAGYSFSRGHFIVNVPYDAYQPFIFQGEEMAIGIRGFTIGYDFYAPERSVCFHHYDLAQTPKFRHFEENMNIFPNSALIEKKAMSRLLGIVHMNPGGDRRKKLWDYTDETLYGIGGVRTPKQFYELFGINVAQKTVQHHLCDFVDVGAQMHHSFVPYLRKENRMGIDYSKIVFRFVDPRPNEIDYYEEED